jgi:cystathionine gamma-lyase
MSPYFQNPLKLGAHLVVHSVTKYINGHSDCVMGVAVTNDDKIHEDLAFLQNAMGIVPSPFDCSMALRGVKTLHLRMERHEQNASKLAEFLEKHEKVEKVVYPGLKSHPQHEIAKTQMRGFGGMITFYLKGGLEQSRVFLENLKVFTLAESLGGVESLAEHPALMTHASVAPEIRKELNIADNMIRLSVGVEDIKDLIDDVKNALEKVKL